MMGLENNNQKNELRIDINDIFRDLVKDFWLLVIIGLSAAMCTYMIADRFYKPTYKTSATLVVTTKGSNAVYINLAAANMVAETLTKVFSSTVLNNQVTADINMDYVPGTVEAEIITETNLFVLTVKSSSPYMAYKIITSIIKNYTTLTSDIFGNAILDILEAPEVPTAPNNSINSGKVMLFAFALGMAAAAAIIAALSAARDNIKNEEDAAQKLDTKLFGVICHENKYKSLRSRLLLKKKSLLITSATVSFYFVESIRKMRAKFEYKASQNKMKVILVTSVLENEGKTTIAANLALALAQKKNQVLLMDADFMKPSIYLMLQKKVLSHQEIGECIINRSDFKDALIYDENSGLNLLIGSRQYKNSIDLQIKDSFQNIIISSKDIMDYVIIDAPPISVSAITEILADTADAALMVVRQSMAGTKSINDAVDLLTGCKSELLGCVYNNVHSGAFRRRFGYGYRYGYKNYSGHYEIQPSARNS